MAHTKAKGTSKLGRDSISKRLGVKVFGGQKIGTGQIIIRQRGSKFLAGSGTAMGADDTLYSKKEGVVKFSKQNIYHFTGKKAEKTVITVE